MIRGDPAPATLASAFKIAWPASLAAILTPVLGLTDIAVLGRAEGAEVLAGASLAGALFSIVYWTLGFLRMSLSGLAAQALGAGDVPRLKGYLVQGACLGGLMGLIILALSPLIFAAGYELMVATTAASAEAGEAMRAYLHVRVVAAPFALTTTALLGWLTGQGRTGLLMAITVGTALVNALLSIIFVLVLDLGISGLAGATALAEFGGFAAACAACLAVLKTHGARLHRRDLLEARSGVRAVLGLNRDIFIRNILLTFVIASFARLGAGFGDLTLAANHVLLNLVMTVTLLIDGTAIAGETLVGQALGAQHQRQMLFRSAYRTTALLAAGLSILLTLMLALVGPELAGLIVGEGPDTGALLAKMNRYFLWASLAPLAFGLAFQIDGYYIGATRGRTLRNTMALSSLAYILLAALLLPAFGNHGLWATLLLFMLFRGAALIWTWRGFKPMFAA